MSYISSFVVLARRLRRRRPSPSSVRRPFFVVRSSSSSPVVVRPSSSVRRRPSSSIHPIKKSADPLRAVERLTRKSGKFKRHTALRAVERVGVPLSICRSLFFYVFYSFLSFSSKVIRLLITNLYQIPPKPSPAEANPSPEHPGGTRVGPVVPPSPNSDSEISASDSDSVKF